MDTALDEWSDIDIDREPGYDTSFDDEYERFREKIKDSERFDAEAGVFDEPTLKTLYKLVNDDVFDAIGRPISTGKEADIYQAVKHENGERIDLALKIYRINTSSFDEMRYYLEGDPRFDDIHGIKKDVVIAWVKKEASNLRRAAAADVRVPKPVGAERNVLAMEYLGTERNRAPEIRDVELTNPETAYGVVKEYLKRMYRAGLVHGDLSEYNLLVQADDIVVIDMGQAVTVHHPNSRELLVNDCRNVARYFKSLGVESPPRELLDEVLEVRD
ncbi:MAG: RIO1 family regulatory kinase/ATPase [Halobacteria archaeon]